MFDRRSRGRIGVDALETARLRQRLGNNPMLEAELFTDRERSYCAVQYDPIQHLTGRFCIKEAVVKALCIDGFDPLDIEVLDPSPAPRVQLHGDAARVADYLRVDIAVSLTHLQSIAIAVAVTQQIHIIRRIRMSVSELKERSRKLL